YGDAPAGSRLPAYEGVIAEMAAPLGAAGPAHQAEKVGDWWRVPARVLKQLTADPKTVRIYQMAGRQMEPTINLGAYVLIDFSQTTPHDGQVYAIDNGISLVLKRIHLGSKRAGKKMAHLTSDAPSSRATDVPLSELKIKGRLIAQLMTPV